MRDRERVRERVRNRRVRKRICVEKRPKALKRSRSFSQDSRSTSPSNASKRGCESWVEKCSTRPAAAACRDFAAGRCRHGSECIYLHEDGGSRQIERHHDSASPDERESRFERGRHQGCVSRESLTDSTQKINYSREKSFRRHDDHFDDKRDNNEQRKHYMSNETCFDFTRNRCHRGASCRYIHHETSIDGERKVRDELSGRVHNTRDGRTSFGHLEPQRVSSVPCKFFLEGRCRHGENCRFFHQVGPLSNAEDRLHPCGRKDADFANNILPIPSAGQNFQQSGQSQIALQVMHAQKFASNSPSQQFVPLLPLNGKMLQVINQSGQNPVTSLHEPSGAHHFIANMQNRSTHPPESNPQKFEYGRQAQAGLLVQSHVGNQQNPIVNERIQQNHPLPHNGQSEPRFTVSGQILQNLPSQVGHSRQDIIVTGDTRQILPQNVQIQQHSFPSLVSNGQIHLVAPKPPLNPEKISSDEKDRQLTSENNLNAQALQQSKQIASGKPLQEADLSEIKSSVFNSDNLITHKFVTTEQAAKITDLSASLVQFFGTAALNSQTRTGILPPADVSPGSLVTVVAPLLTEIQGSITNLNHSAPSALTVLEKSHKQIRTMEQIQEGGDASAKEAENFEKLHNKEELSAPLQNGDPEVRRDGDAKRSKENKGFRMFKCALVELVKDMLKPTWKEGQLSKEAHNTIVKKVVDKVTGSVQGHNAPQTQEKIDLYISNSKAKLSKLVQAYVEKYVGR
ncbi:zinc finger CCCH domain-containing protein 55-like [Dendrobium catenatum]|nr:zinc finger CCCH domain-containing protein 55-like [Dendrobium catenatum]